MTGPNGSFPTKSVTFASAEAGGGGISSGERAATARPAWARLRDRGVVQLAGIGATSFLQGLITNDVSKLAEGEAQFAGLLSPQGKVQFAFLVFRTDDAFYLDVNRAAAGELLKRLTFYRLRAPVALTDMSDQIDVVALWGGDDGAFESVTGGSIVGAHDPRVAALGIRLLFESSAAPPSPTLPAEFEAPLAAYHRHRLAHSVPEAGSDYGVGEVFTHEADLDLLNGVDFHKGCYVGQEVVSRIRHRATARTRALGVEAAESLPEIGTEITIGTVPVGKLTSADGRIGIARLRIDRMEKGFAAGDVLRAATIEMSLRPQPWLTIEATSKSEPTSETPGGK